jgi:hypothetical protein
MNIELKNGMRELINGVEKIFYDGYWITYYKAPPDSLEARQKLIQSLTRRLFHHMEHGIDIPGQYLDQVRHNYESESDPQKKRVKGAMLAGTLFNRAATIFNHLVELEASGIKIEPESDLMKTCGDCLQEALVMGKMVKHRNGDEGIDELWGEPFKAFVMSIADFYDSRYVKIAMTMRNIDEIAGYMIKYAGGTPVNSDLVELINRYATAAKHKCETLRTDQDNYDVWSEFVVAGENITEFPFAEIEATDWQARRDKLDRRYLLKAGVRLIAFVTRARTPMPQSTDKFHTECKIYSS